MLDTRARILLKTLVERYIAEGQPVGSRALSRYSGLDLSPATIRNVMADLEELGFIASPHTSAGRIPTPRGYRLFVDSLLTIQPLDQRRTEPARGNAAAGPAAAADQPASQLLSRTDPFRRRGRIAAAQVARLPAHRIPVAVGAARPADHRHPRRRRAEPHPVHRQSLLAGRTARRRPTSSTSTTPASPSTRSARACQRRTQAAALRHDGADDRRRSKPATRRWRRARKTTSSPARGTCSTRRISPPTWRGCASCSTCSTARRGSCRSSTCPTAPRACRSSSAANRASRRSTSAAWSPRPTKSTARSSARVGVIGPTRMAYERVIPIVDITAKLLSSALSQH